ncbi:Uma2 family endonuclease [Microbispora hainanensis]|uniref:Uma2 family endonuclease n=1 Tax=Microbispora hainanensis TaxID=568844 RepID=UPI0033C29700
MALTKPTKRGRRDHRVPQKQDDPAPDDPVLGEDEPQQEARKPEPDEPQALPDEVLHLCMRLNDAGYRAEIRRGQVVVSPWMSEESNEIVYRLTKLLLPLITAKGWRFFCNWAVHIPPMLDHRLPDLLVLPMKAERLDRMRVHGHSVLLAVEVCSPGNHEIDWKEKPLDYARAGVPLYLIVDPVASPRRVTLMSDPLSDLQPFDYDRLPYRQIVTVEEGGVLELPEPFGMKIETSALFDPVVSPPEPAE